MCVRTQLYAYMCILHIALPVLKRLVASQPCCVPQRRVTLGVLSYVQPKQNPPDCPQSTNGCPVHRAQTTASKPVVLFTSPWLEHILTLPTPVFGCEQIPVESRRTSQHATWLLFRHTHYLFLLVQHVDSLIHPRCVDDQKHALLAPSANSIVFNDGQGATNFEIFFHKSYTKNFPFHRISQKGFLERYEDFLLVELVARST